MKRSYWLFLFTFALVFYSLGASFIESFVNYRTWYFIGAEEFRAYHHVLGPRIITLMVIPIFSLPIFNLILLFYRPPAIPLWSIMVSLALTLTVIVISVT